MLINSYSHANCGGKIISNNMFHGNEQKCTKLMVMVKKKKKKGNKITVNQA